MVSALMNGGFTMVKGVSSGSADDWVGALFCKLSVYQYPDPDPDFEYFKAEKKKAVGAFYRELANLDVWVALSATIPLTLDEWITHDEYWQEAIIQSVSDIVEARNKKSKEESDKIVAQMGADKEKAPYVSPFASSGLKPSFQF